METKIFLWGYFSSALGLVTWCAPSLLNFLLRVLADSWPFRGSQSSRAGWLTPEGNAVKSDLFCIFNRPQTRMQQATTPQLKEWIRLLSFQPKCTSDCALTRGLQHAVGVSTINPRLQVPLQADVGVASLSCAVGPLGSCCKRVWRWQAMWKAVVSLGRSSSPMCCSLFMVLHTRSNIGRELTHFCMFWRWLLQLPYWKSSLTDSLDENNMHTLNKLETSKSARILIYHSDTSQ